MTVVADILSSRLGKKKIDDYRQEVTGLRHVYPFRQRDVYQGGYGFSVLAQKLGIPREVLINDATFTRNPDNIDHATLIVGNRSNGSEDYWINKNSWGPEWEVETGF
ncbi:hypothetical protein Scep_004738 [Stephania cephalantha]|uniref:Peptidase C1A papain C-terminal domain-containing protein n=1 Tax=Stephania cephalantha TaxID=152367 RepID=A0AAP0KUN1_9MAGN